MSHTLTLFTPLSPLSVRLRIPSPLLIRHPFSSLPLLILPPSLPLPILILHLTSQYLSSSFTSPLSAARAVASALRQGLAVDRSHSIVERLQALLSGGASVTGDATSTTTSSSLSSSSSSSAAAASPSHNVYPFIRLGAAKVLDVYYR